MRKGERFNLKRKQNIAFMSPTNEERESCVPAESAVTAVEKKASLTKCWKEAEEEEEGRNAEGSASYCCRFKLYRRP